jgi:hypothetical protein
MKSLSSLCARPPLLVARASVGARTMWSVKKVNPFDMQTRVLLDVAV